MRVKAVGLQSRRLSCKKRDSAVFVSEQEGNIRCIYSMCIYVYMHVWVESTCIYTHVFMCVGSTRELGQPNPNVGNRVE